MKAESKTKKENSQLIFNEDIPCPDGNIMFHVMLKLFPSFPFAVLFESSNLCAAS